MVEEGLGLDVAGGGEIVTALRAGRRSRQRSSCTASPRATKRSRWPWRTRSAWWWSTTPTTSIASRRPYPTARAQDVLVRVIPGVGADTHAQRAHRSRGLEVRAVPGRGRRADRAVRSQPAAAYARPPPPRRLADPRRGALPANPWRRSPRWASSRSTTSAVASVRATPTPTSRPPVGGVPRRARGRGARAPAGRGRAHHRAGRSMLASTATTLYRVATVNRGASARSWPSTAAWCDNLEVALYGQRFEAGVAGPAGLDARRGGVTVVGRHCESGDVLIDGVRLDGPRVGDLLAVPATGAYCFTMANNYNGNRRIPVVFVADGGPGSWCAARPGPTSSLATWTRTRMVPRARRSAMASLRDQLPRRKPVAVKPGRVRGAERLAGAAATQPGRAPPNGALAPSAPPERLAGGLASPKYKGGP